MKISVLLINGDRLYRTVMDFGDEVTMGSHPKDNIIVEGFTKQNIVLKYKNQGIALAAKDNFNVVMKVVPMDSLVILDKANGVYMYFSTYYPESKRTVKLPYSGVFKLGRSIDKNDIVIDMPFVSSRHLTLICEGGTIRVEDNDSTNGTFLNGKSITVGRMNSGDELSILSVKITLRNNELFFEGVDNHIIVRNISNNLNRVENVSLIKDNKDLVYHKSPRMQDRLPHEEIMLSNPPSKGQKFEKTHGMGSMIASSAAMTGASLLSSAVSPALIAARSASLVSPVASASRTSKMNKKRKKSLEEYARERSERYGAYIYNQKAKIESVAEVQRNILTKENPAPSECLKTVINLKRNLWERLPSDRDFLDVRLGMGYEDLCVPVKSRNNANGFQMEDDEAEELCEQIIEETRIVDNVPRRIPLLKSNTVGFVGENREMIISLVRNMLVSLCTSHSHENLRIVGIFDSDEMDFWSSIKWLPHIWDDDKAHRLLSFGNDSAEAICDYLTDMLSGRQKDLSATNSKEDAVPNPYYVIILGSKKAVENSMLMNYLFTGRPGMGVSTLFLFDEYYQLPPECRCIVDLHSSPCVYDRSEANKKYYFTLDKVITTGEFDSFARRMSAIKLEGFATKTALPKSITFLEGYGVKRVEDLNVLARWSMAQPYNSLAAPLGKLAGDVVFSLDIHEKAHGPHGLVAGTTGSGKSEILQAWILSMACTYHPHDVSFVLIDYKGGGMANLLEPLPHVVGKITNIGSNINRSMVSLNSELKRRQVIFDRYGVNHIDKYQKLYKQGQAEDPLPHLIIVADEFAELKKEEPDFMRALIQAARVGRSLGVHLVLATQKPGGVVDDQIQSNSRFRLCLKVQDATDSREMIKRPDASRIVQSGRSFIRVGEDEYFDLFQSFWSGAPYYEDDQEHQDDENNIRIVTISGGRIDLFENRKTKKKSDLDEITAVVKYIAKTTEEAGIVPVPGPWLPELPEDLTLDDLKLNCGYMNGVWNTKPEWLKVPVGMYDLPVLQQQGIQYLNFAENGNHAIYGAPGTGKTTFLKTLITSLCRYYTPEDVTIYVIDCGGWGLSIFGQMPHVGGVALDCEEEKIMKLEKMIREEFTRRKKLFLSNSVSSLAAYRESVGPMPAMFVIVDNIVPIFENYQELENFFIKLASEGTTYGIYLVYTATNTSGVRYKVVQNMKGCVAFELTDRGEYANVVGRLNSGMALPNILGRAYAKSNPPIEFQTALASGGITDRDRNEKIQELVTSMNHHWDGYRPDEIPVLPETIDTEMMMGRYNNRYVLPVGIDRTDIKTAEFDLSQNYCMLVSGHSNSGKSKFLMNVTNMVNNKFPDTLVYVFDSDKGSLNSLSSIAHRYMKNNDDAGVSDAINEIVDTLNKRMDARKAAEANAGGVIDKAAFVEQYPLIYIVVDDTVEFVSDVSDANRDSMNKICRLAEYLGVVFIGAGRIGDVAKYSTIEPLHITLASYQYGLLISGTPNQATFFENNLKYTDKDTELEPGNAYMYTAGKCIAIKHIT